MCCVVLKRTTFCIAKHLLATACGPRHTKKSQTKFLCGMNDMFGVSAHCAVDVCNTFTKHNGSGQVVRVGQQPHEFLTRNTYVMVVIVWWWSYAYVVYIICMACSGGIAV